MSSLFEEWIYRYGYPIMIGGGLLIIVIYIIYYWIRSKKVDKQYKKYKEDQSMTQIHQPISLLIILKTKSLLIFFLFPFLKNTKKFNFNANKLIHSFFLSD